MLSDLDFVHLVKTYGPGAVGVLTAAEAMGLPLPAESSLVTVAIFAGTTGHLAIVPLVAAAALGAIVGDNIGFFIGHTLGVRALRRWGRHIGLTEERLLLSQYLFRRHGGKVVFFARFVALLRTFAALLAGANRMEWRRFLVANAAGGITWASLYGFGAYWLGDAVHRITGPVGIAGVAFAIVAIALAWIALRRHEAELIQRAKAEMAKR